MNEGRRQYIKEMRRENTMQNLNKKVIYLLFAASLSFPMTESSASNPIETPLTPATCNQSGVFLCDPELKDHNILISHSFKNYSQTNFGYSLHPNNQMALLKFENTSGTDPNDTKAYWTISDLWSPFSFISSSNNVLVGGTNTHRREMQFRNYGNSSDNTRKNFTNEIMAAFQSLTPNQNGFDYPNKLSALRLVESNSKFFIINPTPANASKMHFGNITMGFDLFQDYFGDQPISLQSDIDNSTEPAFFKPYLRVKEDNKFNQTCFDHFFQDKALNSPTTPSNILSRSCANPGGGLNANIKEVNASSFQLLLKYRVALIREYKISNTMHNLLWNDNDPNSIMTRNFMHFNIRLVFKKDRGSNDVTWNGKTRTEDSIVATFSIFNAQDFCYTSFGYTKAQNYCDSVGNVLAGGINNFQKPFEGTAKFGNEPDEGSGNYVVDLGLNDVFGSQSNAQTAVINMANGQWIDLTLNKRKFPNNFSTSLASAEASCKSQYTNSAQRDYICDLTSTDIGQYKLNSISFGGDMSGVWKFGVQLKDINLQESN